MLDSVAKHRISIEVYMSIKKALESYAEKVGDLPWVDDLLYARMTDAAMLVLISSDDVQDWLRGQGYLKDSNP